VYAIKAIRCYFFGDLVAGLTKLQNQQFYFTDSGCGNLAWSAAGISVKEGNA
jgi:hypothetical protein